ncbi:hypothetical protein [Halobacillus sp. A5]|uniref:hypothetical protein n=1 Tax=Halobacillus sp. A5 TaxID=2880263 RepID=UPI0020A631AE|nr:hypothetical protein [Halobacillus sp. A5]MCP3026013.1 hypothetical protein [Halobacillus sp. A5]
MDLLKIIIPVVSVIIGFGLGWLKEYIQHTPKVKLSLINSESSFDMYKVVRDNIGGYSSIRDVDYSELTNMDFNINLLFYNSGKGDTAITDVTLKVTDGVNSLLLHNKKKAIETPIFFNLAARSVHSVKFTNNLPYEENTKFAFNSELIDPVGKIKITVISTDINGKQTCLNVDPLSIIRTK